MSLPTFRMRNGKISVVDLAADGALGRGGKGLLIKCPGLVTEWIEVLGNPQPGSPFARHAALS